MNEDQWNENDDNEARIAELDRIIAADDLPARADALVEKAQLMHAEDSPDFALLMAHLQAAIDLNLELAREAELVFPYWMLGDVYVAKKDDEAARAAYLECLKYARLTSAAHFVLPSCLSALATIARRGRNELQAIEYLTESIDELRESSPGSMQLFNQLMQIERSYEALNMFTEAEACLDEAYQIAVSMNHIRPMNDAYLEKIWLRIRSNRLDEIPQLLEKLEAQLEMATHPFAQGFFDILVLSHQIRTNPTVETIKGLDSLREIGRERGDAGMLGLVNIERARFFIAVGNYAEARKVLRKLEITAPENLSRRFSLHEVHLLTAEAFEREGQWLPAIEYVQKAIETSSIVPVEGEADQLKLRLGELYLQSGSTAMALAELESLSLDTWQPEQEGWIRQTFALARAYEASDRHTESLFMANQLLCKIEPDGSAVMPEFDFPANLDANWLSAQLHELKFQALQALGEVETAASEAERAKAVYERNEDFESMVRISREIKAVNRTLVTREQKIAKQQEERGELPGAYWH